MELTEAADKEMPETNNSGVMEEIKRLPVGEKATDEELMRDETDEHFFISSGSDVRETYYVSSVDFELDGITYILMGFDLDMTADELFGMAEEMLAAK